MVHIHENYQDSFLDIFWLNLSSVSNFFQVCYTYGVFVLKKPGFCSDEVFQMCYKHGFSQDFEAHLDSSGTTPSKLLERKIFLSYNMELNTE